jgi:hypothetical protein
MRKATTDLKPDELVAALRRAEEQVLQERRRADLAEISAKKAWELALWGGPRRVREDQTS